MFRCPECKQTDSFTIRAQQYVNIHVDKEESAHLHRGIDEPGNIEWSDDNTMQCDECGKDADVSDFRQSVEEFELEENNSKENE